MARRDKLTLIVALQVKGYAADKLDEALEGVKVVVIPAGVPRKVCNVDLAFATELTTSRLFAAWCTQSSPLSPPFSVLTPYLDDP